MRVKKLDKGSWITLLENYKYYLERDDNDNRTGIS
jgi:hypothetical protein